MEIGINTMTVSKAYQILKSEGYILTDRKNGARVRMEINQSKTLSAQNKDELRRIVSEAKGMQLFLGDLVQMRKTHPCGSDRWVITRTGADIKIKCEGCGRVVMLDRPEFEKRVKKILTAHAEE